MARKLETVYRASLTLIDGVFERDVAVVESDGKITDILSNDEFDRRGESDRRVIDLDNRALLPGQINVHSHAFQRSLRGKTEYRHQGEGDDDFWSWRTEMYRLANRITADEMEIIARLAFLEMSRSGITHVGEFHYVHHRPDGGEYENPNELALRIAEAAKEVGLRITLMPVAYHTGDIDRPAKKEQRRFIHGDVETYLQRVHALAEHFEDAALVEVAMAPHSIRAVPRGWMEAIAESAKAASMPVHIHVCEQRQEVQASRQAYGAAPVEALYEWGVLDASWTLIHGTHLSDREFDIVEEVRPTIGACPSTERNLGDGFLPAQALVERGVPIALGSDSHTLIDPFTEMRLVEYHERLRCEERNVLVRSSGEALSSSAHLLWPMGTRHGARSLGTTGGALREGAPADLVAVDLDHLSIAGATATTLLSDVVLSMSADAVRHVVVNGQPVVVEGAHEREREWIGQYRELMTRYAAGE